MQDTQPREILDFWFADRDDAGQPAYRDQWFKRDDAFDAQIAQRFGAIVERALAGELDGELAGWADSAEGALALVILLDQFPRNLFRGTARAFAGDARALRLAKQAIAQGFDRQLPRYNRMFLYLPFEHSEHLADQDRSVALFAALDDDNVARYAVAHRDIVARFGRFPHRNAALGRPSTPEETEFLKQPGSSF
jgi:uncharacterized protein (DUF924 family)